MKGLFYSDSALARIEQEFGVEQGVWPLTDESANAALAAIQAQGSNALISGKMLAAWEDFLLELAAESLPEEEQGYLAALAERVRDGR